MLVHHHLASQSSRKLIDYALLCDTHIKTCDRKIRELRLIKNDCLVKKFILKSQNYSVLFCIRCHACMCHALHFKLQELYALVWLQLQKQKDVCSLSGVKGDWTPNSLTKLSFDEIVPRNPADNNVQGGDYSLRNIVIIKSCLLLLISTRWNEITPMLMHRIIPYIV